MTYVPTVDARCCRVWPVSPLHRIGRCGICGERPAIRCALSHNGYGCKLGAGHDGDLHRGADGHEWHTDESWGRHE